MLPQRYLIAFGKDGVFADDFLMRTATKLPNTGAICFATQQFFYKMITKIL
jgi:hypothetical protein